VRTERRLVAGAALGDWKWWVNFAEQVPVRLPSPRAAPARSFGPNPGVPERILPRKPPIYAFSTEILLHNRPILSP
jgi:hypothetical protein